MILHQIENLAKVVYRKKKKKKTRKKEKKKKTLLVALIGNIPLTKLFLMFFICIS
jgi:hypothetical protein